MSSSKLIYAGTLLLMACYSGATIPPAHAISAQAKQYARQCRDAANNEVRIANCTGILSLSGIPTDGRAAMLFYRSMAFRNMSQLDKALADINESIRLDQTPAAIAEGRNSRGNILVAKFDFDRAIEEYSEAIRLRPQIRKIVLKNRGSAWAKKGEFDKAIDDLNQAILLCEKDKDTVYAARSYNARGAIWLARGDDDRAMADYRKAIGSNAKDPEPHINLANLWRDKADYNKAFEEYQEAIRLNPKDAKPYALRGEARRLSGDLDGAIVDLDEALRIDPKGVLYLAFRGATLRYRGELDRAIADFDAALGVIPDFPLAFTGRGLTYEKKGDFARAKADFESALKVDNPYKYDTVIEAQATARARLAALGSIAVQPVIPPAPAKVTSATSVPTPAISPSIGASPARIPPLHAAGAGPGRRVALVIGNASYRNVPALINPPKDAEAIAASLRTIGFDKVTVLADTTLEKLNEGLRAFAEEADKADWAMVYYAGHGIEVSGQNYLIPVEARLAADRDVEFETVPLERIKTALAGAKKLRLVVLDACRVNPFAQQMRRTEAVAAASPSTAGGVVGTRSIGRGLGRVEVQSGPLLVVFAAKDGQTALDGDGANSPFAVAMVQRIATPGVEISKIFRLVRDDVMEATAGRQEPYTYGSLPGEDFFFVAKN
jgi:tetratricopeptide (TPR) repeat protein